MEELRERILESFAKSKNLRVLFLFDAAGTWSEAVEALQLEDIHKELYSGNDFSLKTHLYGGAWAGKKVFLYYRQSRPETQEELQNFALLDVLLANAVLAMDSVEQFVQAFNLSREAQQLVKPYMAELQRGVVQKALMPLLNGAEILDAQSLARGLIGFYLRAPQPEPWHFLIGRLLSLSVAAPAECAKVVRQIEKLRLTPFLLTAINKWLETTISNLEETTLRSVLQKVKYNAITALLPPLPTAPYSQLRISHGGVLHIFTVQFRQLLEQPKTGPAFRTALETGAPDIREEALLSAYGPGASWHWLTQNLQWLLLQSAINGLPQQPDSALRMLSQLALEPDLPPLFYHALQAVKYAGQCLAGIQKAAGRHLSSPEDFIAAYKEEGAVIDTDYRKSVWHRHEAEAGDLPADFSLATLAATLNETYSRWLDKSNRNWLQSAATAGFNWKAIAVTRQWDFYATHIAPLDQKVVVVISDALRYEAGVELLNRLHDGTKNVATPHVMLAALPSKTSVGMSNLLPGKERLFNGSQVRIDGYPVASLEERGAQLRRYAPSAQALRYTDIMQFGSKDRQQARDLFKDDVTYIYHDTIDARGDARKSEHQTFGAVEEALTELVSLVKKLHGQWNVSKVFITADHGFLYQEGIEDKDKENAPQVANPVLAHNRYVVYRQKVVPEFGYALPLSGVSAFTDADDLWITIPAATNRYRRSGAGHQYVHGGGSLQELLVPVIESGQKRQEVVSKVGVRLQNQNPKIVSNTLRVELFQEEALSRYVKSRRLLIALYSGTTEVSGRALLVLESRDTNPTGRQAEAFVTLLPGAATAESYQLKVFDEEDPLNPLIDHKVQNQTLIQPDF